MNNWKTRYMVDDAGDQKEQFFNQVQHLAGEIYTQAQQVDIRPKVLQIVERANFWTRAQILTELKHLFVQEAEKDLWMAHMQDGRRLSEHILSYLEATDSLYYQFIQKYGIEHESHDAIELRGMMYRNQIVQLSMYLEGLYIMQ